MVFHKKWLIRSNAAFIESFLLLLLVGCIGRPSRVKSPIIDPDKVGQMAIAQYDTDADRVLSAEELAHVLV